MMDFGPAEVFEWKDWPHELTVRMSELLQKRGSGVDLTSEESAELSKIETAFRYYTITRVRRFETKDDEEFIAKSLDEKLLAIYQRLRGLEER